MRRLLLGALGLFLAFVLTGCFSKSGDELLALPKQPQDSVKLQLQIDKQLAQGAQLLSPVNGANLQAIQKVDLDGDGVEETVVFYRVQGEKPLSIVFYRKGSDYEQYAYIEGEGDAVDSISYTDLNGDGLPEVIVGWRAGTLKALTVHVPHDGQMEALLSVGYSGYALQDINEDDQTELVVLRHSDAKTGVAELYGMKGMDIAMLSQASLSQGIDKLTRVKAGLLADGHQGLYVSAVYDTSAVLTDILAVRDGQLVNITLDEKSGVSDKTVRRNTTPVITDMLADGVLEVPIPVGLPPYHTDRENIENPWMKIEWRNYNIWGYAQTLKITYHNYTDGWYFELPTDWAERLVMTRQDMTPGERGLVFAVRMEGELAPRDLMVVYTLSGDNRAARAKVNDRITLLSHKNMTVVAELLPGFSGTFWMSQEDLSRRFSFIQQEWSSGELDMS